MSPPREHRPADPGELCILTVHAHPDDEASKGAPTLAKYHAEGVRTVLVCCTGGEEGGIHNPALQGEAGPFHGLEGDEYAAKLHQVRMAELAQSAEVIGFSDVVFLGYRDSGMKDDPANEHPECFHRADLDESVGRLVTVIRRTRPQVIITYNDDQQGYPHPDHVKVHDISLPAFQRAGDPMWYPWAGDPWQPSKLYYTAWSRARMLAVHQALLDLRGSSPFDEKWFERPSQDHRITTRVEIADYVWARTQALLAHATQIDPSEPFWFGLSDDELARTYPFEDWVLATSAVGGPEPGEIEDDLFAGIREVAWR
jgi:mycothiol S-conjugate amidase